MAAAAYMGPVLLKQSVTYNRAIFFGTTAQTLTVVISKAGGAFGAIVGTVTEISNGWYYIALSAADTSIIGDLAYHVTASSGGPLDFVDQVRTHIVDDITLDGFGNVSIASNVKKNQLYTGFSFLMTNATSHAPQTGLTVTAQRSLNGAGFAPCANSVTEISNGIYTINLAATDTNANYVMLRFTATGADDLDMLVITQP